MKTKALHLTHTNRKVCALLGLALAALPTMALAQGTFLTAPDGNPAQALIVAPGGNVSIGVTTPAPVGKLDVGGRVNIGGGNALTLAAQDETRVSRILNPTFNLGAISFEAGFPPAERMRITHGGLVGIGTTNPTHLLHVDGGSDFAGVLRLETSGEGRGAYIQFKDNSAGITIQHVLGQETSVAGGLLTGDTPRALVIAAGGENPIHFGVNDQVVMTILNRGNVGIGTKSPVARLHVEGNGFEQWGTATFSTPSKGSWDSHIHFGETGNWYIRSASTSGKVVIQDGGGNVGIGTDSPQAKLDVNGKVRCEVLELTSDRAAKGAFESVDSREVLQKIASLPISTWHYTNAPGVRHIGPMAQDFKSTFNLGSDDKHIATVDADGVLFAAVQGLNQKFEEALMEKDAEIAALKREVSSLKRDFTARVLALEKFMTDMPTSKSLATESARPIQLSSGNLAAAR